MFVWIPVNTFFFFLREHTQFGGNCRWRVLKRFINLVALVRDMKNSVSHRCIFTSSHVRRRVSLHFVHTHSTSDLPSRRVLPQRIMLPTSFTFFSVSFRRVRSLYLHFRSVLLTGLQMLLFTHSLR